MTRKLLRVFTGLAFTGAALGLGLLAWFPGKFFTAPLGRERRPVRVITPLPRVTEDASSAAEQLAREDRLNARVALGEGEVMTAVLNGNFDGDPEEEQIIAYRRLPEPPAEEGAIHLAYVDYDGTLGGYRRIWDAPIAATRPVTLSLYTQDLIGDRGICVLAGGMNGAGEHTLTVFRKIPLGEGDPASTGGEPLVKIAEIRIDGTIAVRETERSQAYQLGQTGGQSFPILAHGRDYGSENLLDQVEITYTYDRSQDQYVRGSLTRIPGRELEQRRVRELLNGSSGAFESFITGLWYYVSPQGTLDSRQYIYFDPASRELIFYGDETQQVFTWQSSSPTRYGLYLSSQNISVTTLRRILDIELESLDSIRIKVFEDVRLKIGVNAPWDGSYRRAAAPAEDGRGQGWASIPGEAGARGGEPAAGVSRDRVYEGAPGRLRLNGEGTYEFGAGGTGRRGQYVFFFLNGREVLELRSAEGRETYLVYRERAGAEGEEKLNLRRIRLGARGIQELSEPPLSFTAAAERPF
jgi:hypothetical protein